MHACACCVSIPATNHRPEVAADIIAETTSVHRVDNSTEGVEPLSEKPPGYRVPRGSTSHRRLSSDTIIEPVDPVEMHIGRPDIGKYLASTFVKTKPQCEGLGNSAAPRVGSRLYSPNVNQSPGGVLGRQVRLPSGWGYPNKGALSARTRT